MQAQVMQVCGVNQQVCCTVPGARDIEDILNIALTNYSKYKLKLCEQMGVDRDRDCADNERAGVSMWEKAQCTSVQSTENPLTC